MGIKLTGINGWQTFLSSPHHVTAVAVVLLSSSIPIDSSNFLLLTKPPAHEMVALNGSLHNLLGFDMKLLFNACSGDV